MSQAELIDPAVYQTYFFVPPRDDEAGLRTRELEDFLSSVHNELATQAGVASQRIAIGSTEANWSDRLAAIARHVVTDQQGEPREVEMDLRTLHDAVMLRVSALRRGTFAATSLPQLEIPPLASLQSPAPGYLGSLVAYSAEVASRANAAEAARGIAEQRLNGPHETFRTDVGSLVLAEDGDRIGAVFVYQRDDAEAVFPFLMTLPELVLCRLKVGHSRDEIQQRLDETLARHATLRWLIGRFQPSRLALGDLKAANDQITTARAELVDGIERVKAGLRTIGLNRQNFERALDGSPLATERPRLAHYLLEKIARPIEHQAEASLGYCEGTRQVADVHFDSLAATADYHEARETHKLTWVVISLTSVQVVATIGATAEGAASVWDWIWRAGSILLPAALLAWIAIWLIGRRD